MTQFEDDEDDDGEEFFDNEAVIELPFEGSLDLHTFHPREVKDLVPVYLEECQQRGILEVRVIHGKGTGSLRRTVHSILDRLPFVVGYKLGDETSGSWGSTTVTLRPSSASP